MLIPLSHDSLEGRRWPYVTIATILLNFVVFLFTNSSLQQDGKATGEVRAHILVLAARFPDAEMPAEAHDLVDSGRRCCVQLAARQARGRI